MFTQLPWHLIVDIVSRYLSECPLPLYFVCKRLSKLKAALPPKGPAHSRFICEKNYEKHLSRFAIRNGHLSLLKWICKELRYPNRVLDYFCICSEEKESVTRQAYIDNPNMCKKSSTSEGSAMFGAVHSGNLPLLKWLYNKRKMSASFSFCCVIAARKNRLDILQWLLETANSCINDWAGQEAAAYGNLETLTWIIDNDYYSGHASGLFRAAGCQNQITILDWLVKQKFKWDLDLFTDALFWDHASVLEWACANMDHRGTRVAEYEVRTYVGIMVAAKKAALYPVFLRFLRGLVCFPLIEKEAAKFDIDLSQ
jgi:hypothetical protein